MFIRDALYADNQKNEPWWFRSLRRLFAVVFVLSLLIFGYYQIKNVSNFMNTPNIVTIESKRTITFPGFIICPESIVPGLYVNDTKDIIKAEPQFSITCGKLTQMGPEIYSDKNNVPDAECGQQFIDEGNGCLRYPSEPVGEDANDIYVGYNDKDLTTTGLNKTFMFFNIEQNVPSVEDDALNPVETPSYYTIYFNEYQIFDGNEQVKYESRSVLQLVSDRSTNSFNNNFEFNMFPISTGQRSVLEYSIFIHRMFSTSLMGQLDVRPDIFSMEISVDIKSVTKEQTQFVVLPRTPHYMHEEIEKYEYQPISFISNLGGFYGAILAFYIAMFGMSKVEPWGIFQKAIFRCWPCRRSFRRRLAKEYITIAGIPLGEDVDDHSEDASLGDRLQILEYLLKDQFVDAYYLDNLRSTKIRYIERENHYNQLEQLVDTRDKAIETNQKAEELDDESPSARWKSWSRLFGFNGKFVDNDHDNDALSINSEYSFEFLFHEIYISQDTQDAQDAPVEVVVDTH